MLLRHLADGGCDASSPAAVLLSAVPACSNSFRSRIRSAASVAVFGLCASSHPAQLLAEDLCLGLIGFPRPRKSTFSARPEAVRCTTSPIAGVDRPIARPLPDAPSSGPSWAPRRPSRESNSCTSPTTARDQWRATRPAERCGWQPCRPLPMARSSPRLPRHGSGSSGDLSRPLAPFGRPGPATPGSLASAVYGPCHLPCEPIPPALSPHPGE